MKEYIGKSEISKFCQVLESVNSANIPMAMYPRQYLEHLLLHKQYYVGIYSTVLNHILSCSTRSKRDISLIDYGAGNGLLGLFAKFCGFRKVILIDLSPEFIESAKRLATTTAISVDFFVEGTIDDLEINVTGTPDAIVGTDIIEHIYDLDSFLGVLKKLNSNTVTVFSTASNNKNWLKRRSLMKIQRKDEWIGWEKDNFGIAYPSFRQLRRQIILNELTGLTEEETELLVTATRGLKKEDIITACTNFKQSGQTPSPIPHPTNTCDPLTGSWTERLLSFKEYHDLYRSHSFKLRIYKGFYNSTGNTLKDYILALINKCIQYSGKPGICLSPHIILTGA